MLKDDEDPGAENRLDNLGEFLNAIIEFQKEEADPSLDAFLESVSLVSDIDSLEDQEDSVTLMTLHSSKGLEYPVVFVTGLEEGLFPSTKSLMSNEEIEEERRLFYVGITRARRMLYLTMAKQRTIFGQTKFNINSRFIDEIEDNLLDGKEELKEEAYYDVAVDTRQYKYGRYSKFGTNRVDDKNANSYYDKEYANKFKGKADNKNNESGFTFRTAKEFLSGLQKMQKENRNGISLEEFKEGRKVYHKKFGEGIIVSSKPEGDDYILEINFDKAGKKRLMAAFASLDIID